MLLKKPTRLKPGDTVAIVSPSWGGPGTFPAIYENGLKAIAALGLKIKEFPHTRASAEFIRKNPKARADDLNAAFADESIKAIIATIGGDDSVRVLPYLNKKVIAKNPKIVMGYSDTTTLHVFCRLQGLVTLYGPSIMAGFSQMDALPESFKTHVRDMLFNPKPQYVYQPYDEYSEGYPDWGKAENIGKIKETKKAAGWNFLQGKGIAKGELFGGCIEVLEFLKGTDFWPKKNFWKDKILFLETSEEKPSVLQVERMLRNYGTQGAFEKISALLFSRARDYSDEEKLALDKMIVNVVANEFERPDLPIVTNMDFGHTDPQFILPIGIKAEVDCKKKTFRLTES